MNRWRHRKRPAETDAATTGAGVPAVSATGGSNAAGRDQFNPVAIRAEFALPAEAYAPIPDDAAVCGVSNIPTTALFVGRGGDQDRLDAAFADTGEVVVHAVHGLGGVGKSALAAHWAARRNEAVRWWITADTTAAIDADTAALARALQPGLAALPAELQIERAIAWLAAHDRWLLVLDNVENPDHIRPLLDRALNGRVLVTTRRATGWHHHATTLCLGVLEPVDAVDLFTRILTHHGPRDPSGADAVCAETGTAPTAYLDMLAKWPAAMYRRCRMRRRRTHHRPHLARTLDTLADTPDAGDLLRTLAWFAPDNIPRDLFDPVAEPALTRALGRLIAYSMVTDHHDGSLGVHRLVQALARTPDADDPHRRTDDIDNAREQAVSLLALAFPDNHEQPEHWPRYRVLLPHLEVLTSHHPPDQDSAVTAYALDRAASYQRKQGPRDPCHPRLRTQPRRLRACAGRRPSEHLGRPHQPRRHLPGRGRFRPRDPPVRANPEGHRTGARRRPPRHAGLAQQPRRRVPGRGRPRPRHPPLRAGAVDDVERVLGADHPDMLVTRSSLAGAYAAAGDPARAIPLYEQVLTPAQQVLNPGHRFFALIQADLERARAM